MPGQGALVGLTAKLGLDTDDREVENETRGLKDKIEQAIDESEGAPSADTSDLVDDIMGGIEDGVEGSTPTGMFDQEEFDRIQEQFGALGKSMPDKIGGPSAREAASGDGGGASPLDRVMGAGGKFMNVALAGAVGYGILSGVQTLASASPRLGKNMNMISRAMQLFARPLGDVMGRLMEGDVQALLSMAANFNKAYQQKGLPVAIQELATDLATKQGKAGPAETFGRTSGGLMGALLGGAKGAALGAAAGSVGGPLGMLAGGAIGGLAGAGIGGFAGLKIGGAIGEKFDEHVTPILKKEAKDAFVFLNTEFPGWSGEIIDDFPGWKGNIVTTLTSWGGGVIIDEFPGWGDIIDIFPGWLKTSPGIIDPFPGWGKWLTEFEWDIPGSSKIVEVVDDHVPNLDWNVPGIGRVMGGIKSHIDNLGWNVPSAHRVGSIISSKVNPLNWNIPSTSEMLDAAKGEIKDRVDVSSSDRGLYDRAKSVYKKGRSGFGLQHGGLVTSPTEAVVGEAGPEVVAPFSEFMETLDRERERPSRSGRDMPRPQSSGGSGDAGEVVRAVEDLQDELKKLDLSGDVYLDDKVVGEVRRENDQRYRSSRRVTK